MSTRFDSVKNDLSFQAVPGLTGGEVRGAKAEGVEFPKLLDPVDDLPPATVITSVKRDGDNLIVNGVSSDNTEVAKVEVSGLLATLSSVAPGVTEWEARLPAGGKSEINAHAVDRAGNVEALRARKAATPSS
jgi:Tfp pilus assembly protein PilN